MAVLSLVQWDRPRLRPSWLGTHGACQAGKPRAWLVRGHLPVEDFASERQAGGGRRRVAIGGTSLVEVIRRPHADRQWLLQVRAEPVEEAAHVGIAGEARELILKVLGQRLEHKHVVAAA